MPDGTDGGRRAASHPPACLGLRGPLGAGLGGDIVAAVLGIVFLPYATIMYVTVWVPEGVVGFAWALLLFGLLLDLMSWGNVLIYRRAATAYVARYYTPSAQPIRQGDSGSTDAGDGPGAQG